MSKTQYARLRCAVLGLLVVPALSCESSENLFQPQIEVVRVLLSAQAHTLTAIDATYQLTAQSLDASGSVVAGGGTVWSSSSSSVATVDQAGMVTAKSIGNTLIVASSLCCNAADTASITVQPTVAALHVTPSALSLSVGDSADITATAVDANGHPVAGAAVSWASSVTSVAMVNNSGRVRALAAGAAAVSASSSGRTANVSVQVASQSPPPVTRVVASSSADTVRALGDTVRLSAEALDASDQPVAGVTFSWTSLNPAIATVDNMGNTLAKTAGTALIVVGVACCNAADTVNVIVDPAVDTVVVAPASPAVGVGSTVKLTATALDSNGNPVTGTHVTWTSTSTSVATVDATGLVTGVAQGTTNVRAIVSGHSNFAVVSVTASQPPPPPGNYQAVLGDNWLSYATKDAMLGARNFWWYDHMGDLRSAVDLVSDGTFNQVARIKFPQQTSGNSGAAVQQSEAVPNPLNKMWLRIRVKFEPGFTTVGSQPAGYANSYKLLFLMWEGHDGRGQIEFSNTDEYIVGLGVKNRATGSYLQYSENLLPGSQDFGRVTTEWTDNEWWEYVVYYQKTGSTTARIYFYKRRLTQNGAPVDNAWVFRGWSISGNQTPQVGAVELGGNKNKLNPTNMYLRWGPWEIVDGSAYPNPWGMPYVIN